MKKILITIGLLLTIGCALDKGKSNPYYFNNPIIQENKGCSPVLPSPPKYCESIEYANIISRNLALTSIEGNNLTLSGNNSITEKSKRAKNYTKGMCKKIALKNNRKFAFDFKSNNLCQCIYGELK